MTIVMSTWFNVTQEAGRVGTFTYLRRLCLGMQEELLILYLILTLETLTFMGSEDSQSLIRLEFIPHHTLHFSCGFSSLFWRHRLLGSEKNSFSLCFQCNFLTKKVLHFVPNDLEHRPVEAELRCPKLVSFQEFNSTYSVLFL